ncbi:MAG: winged helix-turn-helix transcriptional regulator [Bacteroidetes bacterium]|nr:winged helix-turn-helix transcriptional regulator [Bacteroidota bacterium]
MNKSDFDLSRQNQHIESRIVAALERISQAFRVLLWQESKTYSLSPIQVQVLIFLSQHSREKRKISYLADEFNMTKPTLSDAIKALEQKNLIRKEYEKNDSRSYVIHLTKKGKDIADKTSFFSEAIRTPVSELYPEDQENMLLSLLSIINYLNKSGVITIQRMCFNCIHYSFSQKGKKHFCHLLNKPLATTELRIDCPEFQQENVE